jgi:transposase InsO family protein
LERLKEFYPFEIKRIQTDNGSEFDGYAHDYLKANNLTHFWNYPCSPKSNAFIERFNRTFKEQFVYRNEDCIADCQEANERIQDYLVWYNTKRYHRGLNYQIPLVYTISLLNNILSNML